MKTKPMKKRWKVLIIILSVMVICTAILGVANAIFGAVYMKDIDALTEKAQPSYDFIQPWLVEDWTVETWEAHVDELKSVGYKGIILQETRYDYNFYYDSNISEVRGTATTTRNNDMLENMFVACDNKDFRVFLGLSVENEWWDFARFGEEEYLDTLAGIDNQMIDELSALFGHHSSFYGWYWAFEMLTNIHKYEEKWAKVINSTIDHLNSLNDNRPLMFSPFKQWLLPQIESQHYNMWSNFFKHVNFRKGDIFAPQDSIGKICGAEPTDRALINTYIFLRACKEACDTNPNVEFYVNCELFASHSRFNSTDLFEAGDERIDYQLKIAKCFTDNICTFSYTHYKSTLGSSEGVYS